MEDIDYTFADYQTGIEIRYVAFDEGITRIVQKHTYIYLFARGKIIQAARPIAHIQNSFA